MNVGVVDYGAGNLASVVRALSFLGAGFKTCSTPDGLEAVDRLIFPGVGEARASMDRLREQGLDEAICMFVKSGRPLLGICIGAQVVLDGSDERDAACLGLVPGRAKRFPSVDGTGAPLKVPHMGWNSVDIVHDDPIFAGIQSGSSFYFVHSYYPAPHGEASVLATSDYGQPFAAAYRLENLVAVQFHPEKSGPVGLRLLSNFLGSDVPAEHGDRGVVERARDAGSAAKRGGGAAWCGSRGDR